MPRSVRPIRIEGNIAYVPLTKGYEAVIDVADIGLVEGFNWQAQVAATTVYAVRSERTKRPRRLIRMHRAIMGDPFGLEVDHRDTDGLNNRRKNLRVATRSENCCNTRTPSNNTSGFKGVSLNQCTGRWKAKITKDGAQRHLGTFDTPERAHAAYRRAAEELHKDFRRTT